MSSTSSTTTGITDLMQLVSTAASPVLSSLLSSSKLRSALAKAPPTDIAQLSDQAMQLQEVDGLFGASAPSTTISSGMAMQDLLSSIYTGTYVNTVG